MIIAVMICNYSPRVFHSAFVTPLASLVQFVSMELVDIHGHEMHGIGPSGTLHPPEELTENNTERREMLLTVL